MRLDTTKGPINERLHGELSSPEALIYLNGHIHDVLRAWTDSTSPVFNIGYFTRTHAWFMNMALCPVWVPDRVLSRVIYMMCCERGLTVRVKYSILASLRVPTHGL